MHILIQALDELLTQGWGKEWKTPAWKQFLLTGDTNRLKSLPKFNEYNYIPVTLLEAIPPPGQLDVTARRLFQACLSAGLPQALGTWLRVHMPDEKQQRERFAIACADARESGFSEAQLAVQVAECVQPLQLPIDAPTLAGKFLLSLDDKQLAKVVADVGRRHRGHAPATTKLFLANAPDRWKTLLSSFREPADVELDTSVWLLPLAASSGKFLEPTAHAFELMKNWNRRFDLGTALYNSDPKRFRAKMVKLTSEQLLAEDSNAHRRLWDQAKQSASWLAENLGIEAVPYLEKYFAAPLDKEDWNRKIQTEYKNEVLDIAAGKLQRDAIPLFEACFATPQPDVHLHALKLWSPIKTAADKKTIAAKLRQTLTCEDSPGLARAARLAGDLDPEAVEAELWSLFSHKSRPVRDAASQSIAKLGDSRLTKSKELWSARRADTRLAAVSWLRNLATPAAAAELKARLEDEEDDDVRDAILLALEKISGASAKADPAELRARITKTLAKLSGPPVDWLDPKKLPAPKLKDGSKLSADWLLYLLYRQSRVKEMRADIEAKPLYAMLDSATTGDLALAITQAFFSSKADADDRWAMAFAALLGDNRLVPVFVRQVKEWADNMRGKLAEYAVQALALLGTDAALLAVDAMAIRYRSKNKNIGKAASEAFAAAAQSRGLTVEELGDLVVPWLGFKPGELRIIDTGKTKIEARIDNDFKLTLRDTLTNKKVAKLPDSIPAQVKAEFKELSANLKEAVKSQLLRMENLMVRQFRWPTARWKELYLDHPLLLPFAQRLVWAAYDNSAKPTATFRALEDRSLTDSADEPFLLPNEGTIGIVHPLELSPATRQAWLKHLADYDIDPPFAQLERPVVSPTPEQKNVKFGREVADTEVNGLTFKGRAERLGWSRGSVCDGGGINFYLKSFPTAGVDVFVETEGMFVGIDMYTEITLGKTFFTKHRSVEIGSYVYDEPGDEKDERLVPYGEVPAIAFSEAMGDLVRISGKNKPPAEEAAENA